MKVGLAFVLAGVLFLGACTPTPPATLDEYYVQIDRSCTVDADCIVQDVGNCCGQYPACTNIDAQVDTTQLNDLCEGQFSVCGFEEIAGCACIDGTCQASNP